MIYNFTVLDETRTAEVRALIDACEIRDGYPPRVQIDHRLNFRKDMDSWFLLYEEGRLEGFASIFAPMADEGEIAICVAPDSRRKGIAGMLLAAARNALWGVGDTAGDTGAGRARDTGYGAAGVSDGGVAGVSGAGAAVGRHLLVCDDRSAPGKAFASKVGAVPDHEERSLKLARQILWRHPDRLALREGGLSDIPAMTKVIAAAFGDPGEETEAFARSSFASGARRAFLGALKGKIVATCFVTDEEGLLSVNTLAVSPDEQGRGYGMEFLCAVLDLIGREHEILIDVDSGNVNAMRLYRHAGFDDVSVVGYYLL
ncbi:MAG TPA: GNAT family N-acetyltransferase [Rectinemataceae bacterium]|nr:GNAT family N-acetyltransferase [Rectinemataceae bacterium]